MTRGPQLGALTFTPGYVLGNKDMRPSGQSLFGEPLTEATLSLTWPFTALRKHRPRGPLGRGAAGGGGRWLSPARTGMLLLSQGPGPGLAGSRGAGLVSTLFSSGIRAPGFTRATWWTCTEASGGCWMCTFTNEGFTEAVHGNWVQGWGTGFHRPVVST